MEPQRRQAEQRAASEELEASLQSSLHFGQLEAVITCSRRLALLASCPLFLGLPNGNDLRRTAVRFANVVAVAVARKRPCLSLFFSWVSQTSSARRRMFGQLF